VLLRKQLVSNLLTAGIAANQRASRPRLVLELYMATAARSDCRTFVSDVAAATISAEIPFADRRLTVCASVNQMFNAVSSCARVARTTAGSSVRPRVSGDTPFCSSRIEHVEITVSRRVTNSSSPPSSKERDSHPLFSRGAITPPHDACRYQRAAYLR